VDCDRLEESACECYRVILQGMPLTHTVTFGEPGDYAFICHLPGHEEYGMRGVVLVE
jgi:plastocyanin